MKQILEFLNKNNISQVWLAREIEVSPSKLNMALKEKRKLTLDEYARICGALGVNTDFFLKPKTKNC